MTKNKVISNPASSQVDKDRLISLVERIERVNQEITDVDTMQNLIYSSVKEGVVYFAVNFVLQVFYQDLLI